MKQEQAYWEEMAKLAKTNPIYIDNRKDSLQTRTLTGILCTFDINKRDAEIKLLLGCTVNDIDVILNFNTGSMRYLFIKNPLEDHEFP